MSQSKVEPHLNYSLKGKESLKSPSPEDVEGKIISPESPTKPQKHKVHYSSFAYDSDLFSLCQEFLTTRNYQGLALLARQKGLPPFLRFKIWPILLKYHPFVIKPYLQPDSIEDEEDQTDSSDDDGIQSEDSISDEETKRENQRSRKKLKRERKLEAKIKKDLKRYIKRLNFKDEKNMNEMEQDIFNVLQASIFRFVKKWGKVIRYDPAMTWIALGLAEWVPPLEKTPYVLIGRDASKQEICIKNLFDDYSEFIAENPGLNDLLEKELESGENHMSFQDIYERLVLVLLHSPEQESESETTSKTTLPLKGGTIEERVSFFIYVFRRLLPELSQFFSEEQILNKFGSNDDEWLIWWLKWCGSKVWSRTDRGCLWDMILGWKTFSPRKDSKLNLNLSADILSKIGPDVFWSPLANDQKTQTTRVLAYPPQLERKDSLKSLINSLALTKIDGNKILKQNTSEEADKSEIPFSRLDPHFELIFIALAVLKSKEIDLIELEQNEIRQFLSKLPTKMHHNSHHHYPNLQNSSFKPSVEESSDKTGPDSSVSSSEESNTTSTTNSSVSTFNMVQKVNNHHVSYMEHIINEAGDLWRKWLWQEMEENE